MKKIAVLFIAHFINEDSIAKFLKLNDELSDICDVFWAYHKENEDDKALPDNICFYIFDMGSIKELQYEPLYDECIHCNVNYILQRFFKDYSTYERYWSIEYDVIFTGNWLLLINSFIDSDADLISCHIEKYSKDKNGCWDWWKPFIWVDKEIPLEKCVKAFNPIFSLSNKALIFMDEFLKKGNSAHFETLMSTALYNNNFKLVDMGGSGEFTPNMLKNKFYIQGSGTNNGTMRFRPVYLKEEIEALEIKNKLFHPLK